MEVNNHLLVLSKYSRLGASSRLRTLQYQNWLEDAGFTVEYSALFDDRYLQKLYAGKNRNAGVARHYLNRISQLRRKTRPGLIWIEYEALPWLPWMIERALLPTSVPIVSDYDDAVFHRYDRHRLAPVRYLLGRKIDLVMKRSQLVTAGNAYLADRARHAGASNVEVVPTVLDLSRYKVRAPSSSSSKVRVGWIGTPDTWEVYGKALFHKIGDTLKAHDARFRAIGAMLTARNEGVLEIAPWSEDTEVSALHDIDIGVMPLTDSPWSKGKCGYKLIQYMACGLPVVASPVGVNKDIVEHGVNGFLAQTDDEWRAAIRQLISDPDLRSRMGAAGRKKVENEYSLQVWGPRVAKVLKAASETKR